MSILKAGERPLFQALPLVSQIFRDAKNGNEYANIKSEYIYLNVVNLRVFSEIVQMLHNSGQRYNLENMLKYVAELPIFFTLEQTNEWEVKRPWNSLEFNPKIDISLEYANELDTSTPSQAYQLNTNAKNHIWQNWLQKTPVHQLREVFDNSAKRLLNWEKARPSVSFLEKNTQLLSNLIGLSSEQGLAWFYCQIVSNSRNDIYNEYLKEKSLISNEPFHDLLSVFEEALEQPKDSLLSLFYSDSLLVEKRIFNELSKIEEPKDYKNSWKDLYEINIPQMNTKLLDTHNLLKLFAKPFQQKPTPISNWSYVKNADIVLKALKLKQPIKILVYGADGVGKSTFVASVLQEAQYYGFSPFLKVEDDKQKKYSELFLANQFVNHLSNCALVLENAENHYDLLEKKSFEQLQIKNNPNVQIWMVSNIKSVNEQLINLFDMVIEVQEMPINNRIELAKKFFEDANIAIRVAQSVRTPSEVIQIAKWCHISQDFSWDNITLLLSGITQANFNIKEGSLALNPVDNTKDFPIIAGNSTLDELTEKLINIYKNHNTYNLLGVEPPKGVLLIGPPGTGKTHFVRNLSKKINIPMFAPDTTKLTKNLSTIRNLFKEIKKYTPCILFLDEIDTLITNPKTSFSIDLERQEIVNTFLTEIDGINSSEGVLIIGATHRFDNIDPAATRSGRLSEVIRVSMPNRAGRIAIWNTHLKNKHVTELKMELLSEASAGFSGADIAESVKRACIFAAQDNAKAVEMKHLLKACDDVFWGSPDGTKISTQEEKSMVAHHEAGHALLGWRNHLIVRRITLIPRGQSLGAVHSTNDEGVHTMSLEALKGRLEMMLGGICSEKVIFGQYKNGGTSDLDAAKQLIHHALVEAGLGKDFYSGEIKNWSNEQRLKMEKEENELMKECFDSATNWLNTNKQLVSELAEVLLEKKEISGEDLIAWKEKVEFSNVQKKINSYHIETVLHDKN